MPQTGVVSVEALRPIVELKDAAVEEEDYARAAHLKQIIKVLHPDNKMTPVSREARHLMDGSAAHPCHKSTRHACTH
jgi:hypothetical protein